MKKLILPLITISIIIPLILALSFTLNPVINDNEPVDTTAPLNCVWGESGDTTETNVTWYKNGVANTTEIAIAGTSSTLTNTYTNKGEIWTCQVNISDGSSVITANDTATIVNAGPTELEIYQDGSLLSDNTTTVYEDTTYNFDINSTDPDGDTLTYSNTPSDYFNANPNDGTFTWTPLYTENSTNITLRAEDESKAALVKMEFFIIYVNDSPEITVTDQIATEDVSFVYDIAATDEENDPVNFSINYTQVNGDGSLSSLVVNKKSDLTANITFNRTGNAPTYEERGNYTVTVSVVDSVNASRNASDSFNLEIVPVNQIPVLQTIPNASGTQGNNFTLQINATDGDDDATLSFTLTHIACSEGTPWNLTTTNTSKNGSAIINQTLNNSHVICQIVNVEVEDENGATDSQTVYFNITNTNDAPIIQENSDFSFNTPGNNNSNLSSANGARFTYKINTTDIDSDTYEGETLSYTSNESLFPITSDGLINLTLNSSHIGNWSIQINVTDDGGLKDTDNLIVEITTNTIPSIQNLTSNSCQEDVSCTIYINAIDPDNGANVSFSSNSSIFQISYHNETAAIMQKTYNNSEVGTYKIKISATDELGASTERDFNFTINNTNDPPFFDMNQDGTADNITIGVVVETYPYNYLVNVSDEDLIYGDNIVFTHQTLVGDPNLFSITKISNTQASINLSPQLGDADTYTIQVILNDSINNTAYDIINFEVFEQSDPPTIDYVKPHRVGGITNFSFAPNTYGSTVAVNFTENRTVTYQANATDPNGDNVTYTWFIDGVQNITNKSLDLSYNFGSSGSYTVKVSAEDEYFETTNFTWTVTVEDINRPPEILNDLLNLTGPNSINGSKDWANYFSYFNSLQRFYDADDDADANNRIDGAETLSLTYNASECRDQVLETVATFTFAGSALTVTPEKLGTCTAKFTATDSQGLSITSNNVLINVTELDNDEDGISETIQQTSNSGGGSSTNTVVVPITEEVDAPSPLKIITPGKVVIYKQKVMQLPIILRSNWSEPLFGITVTVDSNNSQVEFNLSQNYFNRLEPRQEENLTLTVSNFREGGPYQIYVTGTVDSPEFSDTEVILVNSIEAADDGDVYETKITFARDFFNENKECQELNELLNQAENAASDGSYSDAIQLVDTAINGCKYLASQLVDAETQTPSVVRTIRTYTKENAVFIVLGTAALMIVALGIFFTRRKAFD